MALAIVGVGVLTGVAGVTGVGFVNREADVSPSDRALVVETTGCGYAAPSTGTGVVVDDGTVVTAAHVVMRAADVILVDGAGEQQSATVVALDPQRDLAVLVVEGLRLGPTDYTDLAPGDDALIAGAASSGTITALVTDVVSLTIDDVLGTERHTRAGYQLDARTSDGDSGAGLFDSEGALAGMVFAVSSNDHDSTWATASIEIREVVTTTVPTDGPWVCDRRRSRLVRS